MTAEQQEHPKPQPSFRDSGLRPLRPLLPYAASLALVGVALLLAHLVVDLATPSGLTLVFLLAVVISANRFGLWPAVFTSVLGVLAWDYFLTLPYFSLEFSDPRDAFTLVAFLSVSLVISGMTARIQRQNDRLTLLAKTIANSFELSETLSRLATIEQIASFSVSQLERMTGGTAALLLLDRSSPMPLIFPTDQLPEANLRIAMEAVATPLMSSAPIASASGWDILRIDGSNGAIGSVAVPGSRLSSLSSEERQQIETFLTQTAIAIERAKLARDIEHARMVTETERVRNALLTSVSHDLRTPLTTIIGALSTLRLLGATFTQAELFATARREADRLNRFIGNLLDITRLESGALNVSLTAVDIEEVLESAIERAASLLEQRRVEIDMPADLPPAQASHQLLEQVFFNLLDNAAKYSPLNSTIIVRARAQSDRIVVTIADQGRGIPEDLREKIFEKFARFEREDSVSPGTGLGLMICRGFLSVMNGKIGAANRIDGQGAIFTIELKAAAS